MFSNKLIMKSIFFLLTKDEQQWLSYKFNFLTSFQKIDKQNSTYNTVLADIAATANNDHGVHILTLYLCAYVKYKYVIEAYQFRRGRSPLPKWIGESKPLTKLCAQFVELVCKNFKIVYPSFEVYFWDW